MDPKPDASAPAAAAEEHAAYPRLSPEDIEPPPPPVVPPAGANPYVLSAPSSNPPAKGESAPAPSMRSSPLIFFFLVIASLPSLLRPHRSGFGGWIAACRR